MACASPIETFASYAAGRPTGFGCWAVRRLNLLYVRLIGPERFRGAHVCEIGPGRGLFAAECVRLGAQYQGVDGCQAFVDHLRQDGFTMHRATVPPIPRLCPSGYDILFAGGMVEHLPQTRVAEFFVSAGEALSPGGSLCLVAPDAISQRMDFWRAHYSHIWPTTARTLKQAARDAGLTVVKCRRFSLIPGLGWAAQAIPAWTERLESLRLCLGRRVYLEAKKP